MTVQKLSLSKLFQILTTDDDLVEIHMSDWPLVSIASQMHQHLQQVITHLSTMRSHYNPPEKKCALPGANITVQKRQNSK